MKALLIILVSIVIIGFAVWNSYVILWKTEHDINRSKKFSKIWHVIGLVLRVGLYVVPIFYFDNLLDIIKWSFLFVAISGVLYDFIINLIRWIYNGVPDLWYVDNKGWNKTFMNFILIPVKLIVKKFKLKMDEWLLASSSYWILRGIFVLTTIILFII